MRKLVSIALVSLICLSVTAQVDSTVVQAHYRLTHIMDTTQPENPIKQNMILYLGTNMSRYMYDRNPPGSTTTVSDIAVSGGISGGTFRAASGGATISAVTVPAGSMNIYMYSGSLYKDINASQMIYLTIPRYSEKLFAVTESTPAINWTISSETKTILGMPCQKATGRFKGRDYEAWFCSQLPYSNGPWKLGGLPGLILEASDTKKEVVFTLTGFESVIEKPTAIDIPSTVVRASPKEYKQYADALLKDGAASKGGASSGGMMVVSGFAMGPDGKPAKPREMNNPIEKEEPVKN